MSDCEKITGPPPIEFDPLTAAGRKFIHEEVLTPLINQGPEGEQRAARFVERMHWRNEWLTANRIISIERHEEALNE